MRNLAKQVAESYYQRREALGFPSLEENNIMSDQENLGGLETPSESEDLPS